MSRRVISRTRIPTPTVPHREAELQWRGGCGGCPIGNEEPLSSLPPLTPFLTQYPGESDDEFITRLYLVNLIGNLTPGVPNWRSNSLASMIINKGKYGTLYPEADEDRIKFIITKIQEVPSTVTQY